MIVMTHRLFYDTLSHQAIKYLLIGQANITPQW